MSTFWAEDPSTLGAQALAVRFGVSLGLALVIALVYRVTRQGHGYNRSFPVALVVSAVVMTMVMMVVSKSLALSVGMFGAVSVIRFRTAVADPRDLVFLFLGLGVGLACAVSDFVTAALGTATASAVMLFAHLAFRRFRTAPSGCRLSVRLTTGEEAEALQHVVRRIAPTASLLEAAHSRKGLEYVFWFPEPDTELPGVVARLKEHLEGIERVKLVHARTEALEARP